MSHTPQVAKDGTSSIREWIPEIGEHADTISLLRNDGILYRDGDALLVLSEPVREKIKRTLKSIPEWTIGGRPVGMREQYVDHYLDALNDEAIDEQSKIKTLDFIARFNRALEDRKFNKDRDQRHMAFWKKVLSWLETKDKKVLQEVDDLVHETEYDLYDE